MSIRDELLKMALVGTERVAWTPAARQKLADFDLPTNGQEAEYLLKIAAVFSRMERAGAVFQKTEISSNPICPTENWPVVSKKAGRLLGQMLRGLHRPALPEFLELAISHQKRVSPECLPELLTLFFEKKLDWQRHSPALGERGRWLAGLHFQWKYLAENLPDGFDFTTAALIDRLFVLKKMRVENPVAARELIEKTWAEEHWDTRLQFLKTLENGLSLADESLLETALADKRKDIRRLAVQMLAEIPGTRLGNELADFIRKALVFDSKSSRIEVALPENAEAEAARFLPENLVSFQNAPAANAFVAEILACLPLEIWETHFQKTPAQLLALFSASDWSVLIVPSVLEAVSRQKSAAWSAAAIRGWLERPGFASGDSGSLAGLLNELPAPVFDAEISDALTVSTRFLLDSNSPLRATLAGGRAGFWSPGLTKAVFGHLHFWLERLPELVWNGHFLEEFLEKITWQAAPGEAEFIQKSWEKPPRFSPVEPRKMERLLAGLAFRARLSEAMQLVD